MIGITGANLTDLARNSLLNDAQVGNEFAATDERNMRRQQMQQQGNQFLQELALRRAQQDQQTAYLQNALAQQGRIADMEWNNPNATTIAQGQNQLAAAKMPWTMGVTPEQAAQNALAEKQLQIAQAPIDIYKAGGPPPGNGPGAQAFGQLMIDKAQRAEKMDGALKAANAAYLSNSPDSYWEWFGGMRRGSSQLRLANSVKQQLSGAMPEVNELLFDPTANHGHGGFVSPDQAQVAAPNAFVASPNTRTNAVPQMPSGGTNQLLSASGGSGRQLDVDSARALLQQAGGDPVKARQLATQAGFSF